MKRPMLFMILVAGKTDTFGGAFWLHHGEEKMVKLLVAML